MAAARGAVMPARRRTALFGSFDGVHRGHRLLLERARAGGGPVVAITFDPHPKHHFGQRLPLICDLPRRIELLREHGADGVLVLRFDERMAQMPADAWVERVLRPLGVERVVAGEGFRFGCGRTGDERTLRRHGLEVALVPRDTDFASSAIRALVGEGRIEAATEMLGRPFELLVAADEAALPRADGGVALRPAGDGLLLPAPGRYRGSLDGRPLLLEVHPAGARARLTAPRGQWPAPAGARRRILLEAPVALQRCCVPDTRTVR